MCVKCVYTDMTEVNGYPIEHRFMLILTLNGLYIFLLILISMFQVPYVTDFVMTRTKQVLEHSKFRIGCNVAHSEVDIA